MGGFKDPNVYGPFLVLPFTWSLYRIMKGNGRDMLVYLPLCCILTLGILVSFSRAAWAMVPLSFLCLLQFCFFRARATGSVCD